MRMSDIDRRFQEVERRLAKLENNSQDFSVRRAALRFPSRSGLVGPDSALEIESPPSSADNSLVAPDRKAGESENSEGQQLNPPEENQKGDSEGGNIPKKRGRPRKEVMEIDKDTSSGI